MRTVIQLLARKAELLQKIADIEAENERNPLRYQQEGDLAALRAQIVIVDRQLDARQ
jgi:hypothetical protein